MFLYVCFTQCRIFDVGNHKSLLTAWRYYAALYNTYFRHQSLEYVEKARQLADTVA